MPVDACSVKPPLDNCGMPQAYSTTSRPRATSPSASECTLPCSATMTAASSSRRALSSSRKANSTGAALGHGGVPPLLEGVEGGADRLVDHVVAGEVHLGGDLAGGRVVDVTAALGGAGPRPAGDPVGDVLGRHGRTLPSSSAASVAMVRAAPQAPRCRRTAVSLYSPYHPDAPGGPYGRSSAPPASQDRTPSCRSRAPPGPSPAATGCGAPRSRRRGPATTG